MVQASWFPSAWLEGIRTISGFQHYVTTRWQKRDSENQINPDNQWGGRCDSQISHTLRPVNSGEGQISSKRDNQGHWSSKWYYQHPWSLLPNVRSSQALHCGVTIQSNPKQKRRWAFSHSNAPIYSTDGKISLPICRDFALLDPRRQKFLFISYGVFSMIHQDVLWTLQSFRKTRVTQINFIFYYF